MSKPTAASFAAQAAKYLGTPYDELDCQALMEAILRDVGVRKNWAGSNAMYRDMAWVGTPEECVAKYGSIPVGAWLFILEQDGNEPAKYKADGIGNASHVGVYTGSGKGAIHSSASRGEVCESAFASKTIRNGWNRVGLCKLLDYGLDGMELPSEIPSEQPPVNVQYKLGDRILQNGSKGDDVKELQEALNKLPCLVTKLEVDGDFGTNTARAVYTFQTIYEIKVDSKYGPESHKTLMTALEELDKPADAPDEPVQSTPKKVVTIVSQKLVNLRNGDSLEAGCVTQVKGGTKLEYITTINGWHGVRWKNRIVWVSGQFSAVTEA